MLAGYTRSNNGDVILNQGFQDCWIVKLNSSGSVQWSKTFGGASVDEARDIKQTSDGGYIIAGYSSSNNGNVTGNHGSFDYWILKLNASGNILWQKSLGGSGPDYALSIIQDSSGNYIVVGKSFSNDGDITGHHGNITSSDFWVVKLSHCPTGLDLHIKDSPEDTGTEPNTVSPNSWSSNNIWVRLVNNNGTEHQNPEYNGTSSNYVYVKVTNNSCQASTGNEQLEVYWTNANTASSWPASWNGTETIDGTLVKGGLVGTVNIPVIQPGAEAIVPIEWNTIPDPQDYEAVGVGEPWHFCLLARINSPNDPMTYPETENVGYNVFYNNNVASKNVTVINVGSKKEISGSVAVYNPYNNSQGFDLVFAADNSEIGKKIFQEAEVYVKLSDDLYSAWVAGGSQSTNINLASMVNAPLPPNTFRITGDNAKLKNLVLDGKESAVMALKFNFLTKEVTSKTTFTYYVTQKKTINNEVIGGNTFIIQKTPRESFQASANDISANKNEMVTLMVDEINEDAIYNWYDSDGNLIYTGTSLSVVADIAKTYKVEIIADADGYKDYADVEVSLNPHTLQNIAPNPSSNNIAVNYNLNSPHSAYLSIIGYIGNETGVTRNYILNTESAQKNIDISSYAIGYYTVVLICDGQVVGTTNLIKQ